MKGAAGAAKAGKSAGKERVVQNLRQPAPAGTSAGGSFLSLQRSAGTRAVDGLVSDRALPASVVSALRGPSHSLDPETLAAMESRFGREFSAVRVHEDAAAGDSAKALAARAYTVGHDVVFGPGRYAPRTSEGRRLLAHELAHVIQQSRGGQASGRHAEVEAARAGEHAAAGAPVSVNGSAAAGVQCDLMDRGAAEQRLKDLQNKIAAKEKEFGETGADPYKDADYQNYRSEYMALDAQLKRNQWNTVGPKFFGTFKPIDKLTLPDGKVIDLNAAAAAKAPTPPPKGERTLPITISPFGKPIVLAEEKIPDPERRRRVHNLKVDLNALAAQVEAARWAWQDALNQWKVVRVTADVLSGAHPPSFALLGAIIETSKAATEAIRAGDLDEADRQVLKAQKQLVFARGEWQRYRNKNIEGAETLQTGLEYTRDASFLALAIMAPGAGAVGTVIATGAPIAAELAVAGVQVALGDKVDWTQMVLSIAINLLLAKFGGSATNNITKAVAIRLGTQGFARQFVLKLIQSEILHVTSITLNTVVTEALQKYRGKQVTWRQVVDMILSQLADPRGHVAVLIASAVEARAAQLPGGTPKPDEVPPGKAPDQKAPPPKEKGAPPKQQAPPPKEQTPPPAPVEQAPPSKEQTPPPAPKPADAHREAKPADQPPPPAKQETPEPLKAAKPGETPPKADDTPPAKPATDHPEPAQQKAPAAPEGNEAEAQQAAPKKPTGDEAPPPAAAPAPKAAPKPAPKPIDPDIDQAVEQGMGEYTGRRKNPARKPTLRRPANNTASEDARKDFDKISGTRAQQLGVASGGQVHHAIELQALDRYPGVFSKQELNAMPNMRGIPPEDAGRAQLHQSKIREVWNRHYRNLDGEIAKQGLKPGTSAYNNLVRRYLEMGRDEIDHLLGQFFSEYRTGRPRAFQ